jgi:transposase
MWKAFMNAAQKACPKADLVHDNFHVSKYLGDAVNKVRRGETRVLTAKGDDRLTGTRWRWNRNEQNISDEIEESFEG